MKNSFESTMVQNVVGEYHQKLHENNFNWPCQEIVAEKSAKSGNVIRGKVVGLLYRILIQLKN